MRDRPKIPLNHEKLSEKLEPAIRVPSFSNSWQIIAYSGHARAYSFFTRKIGGRHDFTYYILCILIILHKKEGVSNMKFAFPEQNQ